MNHLKKYSGKNLKASLLCMFNEMKNEGKIPEFMKCSNITTIHKKGSKLDLKNERGVSRVSVSRSLFMQRGLWKLSSSEKTNKTNITNKQKHNKQSQVVADINAIQNQFALSLRTSSAPFECFC